MLKWQNKTFQVFFYIKDKDNWNNVYFFAYRNPALTIILIALYLLLY